MPARLRQLGVNLALFRGSSVGTLGSQILVETSSPAATDHPVSYGIKLAAVVAPSSQHASRSFAPSAPVTVTGSRRRFHFRPVTIVSTLRTAPTVSEPPWTYRAYGHPTVASKIG